MSWATDGTQTDTDTDISGIGNVNGVTLYTFGSGSDVRRVARVTVNLTINGTLTLDPEHEELVLVGDKGITINGTFNIGKKITINGVDRYSFGTAIHSTASAAWNDTPYLVEVKNGGKLNWYGGVIYSGGKSLMYASGSTVKVFSQNATFIRTQDGSNAEAQIRMETDNYDQDGFTDVGYNDTQDWFTFVGFWNTFKGFRPVHKKSALSPSSASSSDLYIAENYDASGGCTYDSLFWRKRRMRLRNCVNGSDIKLVGLAANNSNNRGVYEITEDISIKLLDTAQNPISGGMIYFKDYDNGDRKNDNVTGNNVNYVDDREYVATTDSNGSASIQNVLTMAVVRNSGSDIGTPDSGNNKYDYRSKNNDNTDVFDFGIHAYGYLKVATINLPLKGANGVEYERTLIADPSISESGASVVSGYTKIATLDQLYDRASYWHIEDSTGVNIAVPSYGEFLVSASGSMLDLGSVDIVIDPAASSVFSYSSGTITVKSDTILAAGSKFSGIKTTGTITFKAAAVGDNTSYEGTVYLDADQDLSGVSITGDLHINTGANSTLDFSSASISGDIYNDDTAHTLTVNLRDGSTGTAGDPGTGNGETEIRHPVIVKVTVKDGSDGSAVENAHVIIKKKSDKSDIVSGSTDANGVYQTELDYTSDIDIIGWVRQSDLSGTDYEQADISGTIGQYGFTAEVSLKPIS